MNICYACNYLIVITIAKVFSVFIYLYDNSFHCLIAGWEENIAKVIIINICFWKQEEPIFMLPKEGSI